MASYRNYDVKTELIKDNRVNIINNSNSEDKIASIDFNIDDSDDLLI